jgi:5-methylthioadenosine/S-adenosylhomocysteine deaminase
MANERTLIEASMIIAYHPHLNRHVLLRNGVVVFEEDTIIHVGKSYSGAVDRRIDGTKKLISPGFVNAHAELKSAPVLKSLWEDCGSRNFWNWSLPNFQPTLANFTVSDNEARIIAEAALLEILRGGCTTIAEMGAAFRVGPKNLIGLLHDIGLRAYLFGGASSYSWHFSDDHNVTYVPNDDQGLGEVEQSTEFIKKYDEGANGTIRCGLGLAAVDLCTSELLKIVRHRADELNALIRVIGAQSVLEFREMLKRHGETTIEFLAENGIVGPDVTLVHGHITSSHPWTHYPDGGQDIALLANSNTSVADTPWIYARMGIAMHSWVRYLKAGVNLGIGTAGLGIPQDMLSSMSCSIIVSKIIDEAFDAGNAMDAFNAATLGGARTLNRSDLGRISVGAKADLLLFNLNTIRMSPVRDVIKNIVYNAASENIEQVIIAGKSVVRNGNIKGWDEEHIAKKLQKIAETYWANISLNDQQGRSVDELVPLSLPLWES